MPSVGNNDLKRVEAFARFTLWLNEPLSIGPKQSDEAVLYHYGTPIAWRWTAMGVNIVYVNMHRYSHMTSSIRNRLIAELDALGYEHVGAGSVDGPAKHSFPKDSFESAGWLRSDHIWQEWTRGQDDADGIPIE